MSIPESLRERDARGPPGPACHRPGSHVVSCSQHPALLACPWWSLQLRGGQARPSGRLRLQPPSFHLTSHLLPPLCRQPPPHLCNLAF